MSMPAIAVEPLVSVAYVSSSTELLSADELKNLLIEIREKNRERDITGMLLYRGGNFLQVIEGPASAIDELVRVLQGDHRHNGMIVLCRTNIEERQFREWQMAFRDISGEDLKGMEGYSPFFELSFTDAEFTRNPNFAYRLLRQFKERLR